MFTEHVDNLDRMLDELEDLARSDLANSRFFATLTERLRLTIDARSTMLMLPIDGGNWIVIASSGEVHSSVQDELKRRLSECGNQPPTVLMGKLADCQWYATPVRPRNFSKGCLVAVTAHIPESSTSGLLELLAAFSEIVALRQHAELEVFLDHCWDETQALCQQIGGTRSQEEASSLLANGLVSVLNAARVTVMSSRALGGPRVLSVSGIPRPDASSTVIQAIQRIGQELLKSGKPILRQQPYQRTADGRPLAEISPEGTFANLIGTQLESKIGSRSPLLLAIEYQSYSDMIGSATKLPHLLPLVASTWEQHARWLKLPRFIRRLFVGSLQPWNYVAPLLKWSLAVLLVLAIVWALFRPTALTIEAEGALEPVTLRTIFANNDGTIEQLLVEDGSYVEVDQPLVQLRSPALELQIEQSEGDVRAIREEGKGIRIAINQLDSDAADVLSNQSRLAAKIEELDTREKNLEQQLELLYEQRARLVLRSPIAGRIVAKDLTQQLTRRPVRRGDALFSVADFEGAWQIRVHVPDRDSGYLLTHFSEQSADSRRLKSEIQYSLDSRPSNQSQARIEWISELVENRQGEGCFVEVRATVDPADSSGLHAGAGVHAFFDCGQHPTWFVWCRPLIEAAQRRLWLRSHSHEQ